MKSFSDYDSNSISTLLIVFIHFAYYSVLLWPIKVTEKLCRLLITLLTSTLLSISDTNGSHYFLPKLALINNRYFRIFGDISYSLYLYHWPTLLFIKYRCAVDLINSHAVTFLVFAISIILAAISFYCIETYFLSNAVGYLKIYLFIAISYAVVLSLNLSVKYFHHQTKYIYQQKSNMSTSEIIRINEAFGNRIGFPWLNQCEHDIPTIVDKYGVECRTQYHLSCHNNDTTMTNNRNSRVFDVLVLGDSHAHRHFYAIRSALRNLSYTAVHLFAQPGCIPFIDNDLLDAGYHKDCPLFSECITKLVQEMRPHYLFHFTKYTLHVGRYLERHTNEQVSTLIE